MTTRNLIAILACFLTMLMICSSAWSIGGEWMDNFNDNDADGWETRMGTWEVRNGEYRQTNGGGNHTFAYYKPEEADNWDDYTLEVKVNPGGGTYIGLAVRVQQFAPGGGAPFNPAEGDMYMWTMCMSGGTGYSKFWKFRGGTYGPGAQPIDGADADCVKSGEWNTLRVVCKGKTFECYVNDKLQKEVEDDETLLGDAFLTGGIALRTYNATAAFDDVKIIADFFAVDAAGKLAISWGALKSRDM